MKNTSNSTILPPTIKWYEMKERGVLIGIGVEFYLGFRKSRLVWSFDKTPPTTKDIHHARDELEKRVDHKWKKWLNRTTEL